MHPTHHLHGPDLFRFQPSPRSFLWQMKKKTPQKFWRKHTSKDAWLNQIKLQQIDCLYQCTYNHKNVMCFIIYYILLYGQGTCRTCCVFMFFLCKKRNAGFSDLLAAKQSTLSLVVFFSGGKTPTVLIHATCLAVSYIHWIQFFKILQNCCHSWARRQHKFSKDGKAHERIELRKH